ncbi:MAG: ArnT family glycosyltransferase, partial [Candidatus Polarisedimenticolia bacterium]
MDRFLLRVAEPHRPVLALVVLAALVYLPCVWARDPWSPDEPRYAEVARQMAVRGDYLLPSLNGTVYGEKPPLFFWLGMAAGWLPGIPAAAGVRLVSVLAALGTLLLVFHLGRRLGDARGGWLAALVMATSAMFALHATTGVIDATLTLLVTAAIAVGLKAREAGAPTLWGAFYVLAGLGLITKGPVALVVAGGTMLLVALAEDGPRRAWAGHPAWGLPVAAAVVALWLIPAVARGGEAYANVILFKQNLGRAYDSWHHKEPATFFLKVFPASFVPWVAALPLALVSAWRARREDPSARVPLIWFCWTFLFFSLVSGKKTRYLLPLFPAAALLVGRDLARHAERVGRRIAVGLVLCLAAAGSLALLWMGGGGIGRVVAGLEGLAADQREALAALGRWPGASWLILPGAAAGVVAVWGLARLG